MRDSVVAWAILIVSAPSLKSQEQQKRELCERNLQNNDSYLRSVVLGSHGLFWFQNSLFQSLGLSVVIITYIDEAIWAEMMSKKKIVSYLLTIVLFAIFSLPMAGIEFVPLWLFQTRHYGSYGPLYYFSLAVVFLSLISPWVLLSMSVIFRTKGMRIRTYVATCLFAWAAVTQMFYLIMYFISYYNYYYIVRPNWP